MIIEEEFTIGVPIERFYREINDIGEIGYCIAGVKKVEVVSETESKWTVEAKAGFMARTFNLDGRITERREPYYFAFSGKGQDVDVNGHLELEAVNGSATNCRAVIEAEVTGPFSTIVDLMARGPQQQLIRQTITNLRERLELIAAGETPTRPATPPPPEPRVGVRTLLHNWLRRIFKRS